jgi:hypothetical protein
MDVVRSSEISVNLYSGLHGVTSEKIVLFVVTARRASNPTFLTGIKVLDGLCWRLFKKL